MKTELNRLELQTTEYLHSFVGELLGLFASHFGGETTLNHLRIGNFIGLHSLYGQRPTSNKEIAETLGLSRSTVSRIVNDFLRQGWVSEEPDPDDGRRRRLFITQGHPYSDRFERAFRARLNELLARYEKNELVLVDAGKKSF